MKKIYFTCVTICLFAPVVHYSQSACSGTPGANIALASATSICSGATVSLSLQNAYTNSGISYQWQYSAASSLGPFQNIAGATGSVLTTNTLSATGYYTALITCANGNATINAQSVYIQINSPGLTSIVPYYEGFEGILNNDELPNCSWTASNPGTVCKTFTAPVQGGISCVGSKFAAFSNAVPGTNHFFTNGIMLSAGITYSASIWYGTNSISQQWSDLSLLINTSQTPAGSSTIASTNGPAYASTCKQLSGTFTVSSSGIYYVAIRGISTSSSAPYLSIDDLSITIPCDLPGNSPTITISPPSQTVCSNSVATLTAAGADIYSGGGPVFTVAVNSGGSPLVTGTSTLTGCMSTATASIQWQVAPNVFNVPVPPVCEGDSTMLLINGLQVSQSDSIIWNNGSKNTTSVTVIPTITNTVYTYTIFAGECVLDGSFSLTVNQPPQIQLTASDSVICNGDQIMLDASGQMDTYQWLGTQATGHSLFVSPGTSTTYTFVGSSNSCSSQAVIAIVVNECAGVGSHAAEQQRITIYPNPAGSWLRINSAEEIRRIVIIDGMGRKVVDTPVFSSDIGLDISSLQGSIYIISIMGEHSVLKRTFVKN